MYKLTVTVLTYNRPHYLIRMLDSIQVQTYKDFCVVIYDNGSTDNTADVIKPYLIDERFSYHKEIRNNPDIFNIIIKNCQTEYLLIVHDDDIMLPKMIEAEIKILESNKNISLVSTNINYIDTKDKLLQPNILGRMTGNRDYIIKSRKFIEHYIKDENLIACPTVMFRMSVIRENNILFEFKKAGKSCDTYMWLELNQLPYNFYYINEVLYDYRIHEQQDSNNLLEMVPLLKIPVYNLLLENKYSKTTILSWLKYVNNHIVEILGFSKNVENDYKRVKELIFIPVKPSILFRGKLFVVVYCRILLTIYRKTKRVFRKAKDALSYLKIGFNYIRGGDKEIIAIIDGGLGSQMGQFAMGQEIQRITGIPVSYDVTWYKDYGKDIQGRENRNYELETIFPKIKINKAPDNKVMIYRKLFNKHKSDALIQDLDTVDFSRPPIYLGGYWSSEKYTKYNLANLKEMFEFGLVLDADNQNMFEKIQTAKCSVAIQIRMGDYIGSVLDVVTPLFFQKAIEYIMKKISTFEIDFFVFSTDPEKSKTYLPVEYNYTFVNINDNDRGAYDMYLMSQCQHFVISNSTFGIWAALLSDRSNEKIVVQPDKWLKTDIKKMKPKYSGWTVMEC